MPDLDVESLYDADSSDNEENHAKLLNSIFQLDSTKKVKPAQRKEVTSEVSEYNLSSGLSQGKNFVNVKELAQVLGQKSGHEVISKKIKNVTEKSEVLPKPLEKPVEERLKRSIGFDNVKKQLQRWNAIVARNALKDQITFPLNDNSTRLHKSNEFLSQFRTPTHLEEEIAKVLKQENVEEKEAKEDNEFPLTLEEMMEKRKEMAQLRIKLSYKQTKAQRQNKIKSKKYHRLLKREKLKQQLKDFEILQKTDPEAALKKLSELDKARAKERALLRHRNTGQWAKNLTVRAKYDVETRKVLAEQLRMSRELTQKISKPESSDDEEPPDPVVLNSTLLNQDTPTVPSDNPWVINVSKEVQDFVSGYKKFWSEKEKEISQNSLNEKGKEISQNILNGKNISQNTIGKEKDISQNTINGNEKNISQNTMGKEKDISPNTMGKEKDISQNTINGKEKDISQNTKNGNEKNINQNTVNEKEKKISQKTLKGKEINEIRQNVLNKEAEAKTDIKKNKLKDIKKNKLKKVEKKLNDSSNKKNVALTGNSDVLKGDKKLQKVPKKRNHKILSAVNSNEKSKVNSKKIKEYVVVQPASGIWTVTPIVKESEPVNKKKRKVEDIDTLFDELNDKMMKKATKKIKKMEKKLKKSKKTKETVKEPSDLDTEFDLSLKNKNIVERPDLDVGLLEGSGEDQNFEIGSMNSAINNSKVENESAVIDPQKFIQVKPKRLKTHLPDNIAGEEEGLDDEKAQQMIIEEAFGEDDVMAEFKEMKKEEEKSNKIEIETSLPGWGQWAGTGIKPKLRKKKLLVLNLPPRKDKLKKDVIINENENPNLRNHLVKEVPHPFKSVDAFEANIRAPVGREWIPETAHQKLIQKQVVTKLGTIIEPMSEDEIVRFKKASKSPYEGLKKDKI